MASLTLTTLGVIVRDDHVYCMTPESYDSAKAELERIGYDTSSYENSGGTRGLTPEQINIGNGLGWTGELGSAYVGVCGTCGRYISNRGIQTHGHTCELCGAVTYYEFVKGSWIRFEFTDETYVGLSPSELSMTVSEWDTDEGYLYLEYAFHRRGISTVTGDEAHALLDRHPDSWELVESEKGTFLKVPYVLRIPYEAMETDAIRITDSFGDYVNFTTATLWGLYEYPTGQFEARVPLPSLVYLNRAWEWAPLAASPTLYLSVLHSAGVHDDINQYEQWPQFTWTNETYRKMAAFVRDFTSLDSSGWYSIIDRLPRDPILGIESVRYLCWPEYEPRAVSPRPMLYLTPPWRRS